MSDYRKAKNLHKQKNKDAVKKANAAIAKETGGKKLTMEPKDNELRKKWMDAYIAAGGEYETVKSTGKKPKDTVESCEKIEYELVELVEVVTQDEEKWVKGAGMKNTGLAFTPSLLQKTWVRLWDGPP